MRHQQPRRGCRRLVRPRPCDPRQRSARRVRAVSTSRGGSCERAWRRDAVGPRGHGSLHRQGPLQGPHPAGAHEGRQTGERPIAVGHPFPPITRPLLLLLLPRVIHAALPLGSSRQQRQPLSPFPSPASADVFCAQDARDVRRTAITSCLGRYVEERNGAGDRCNLGGFDSRMLIDARSVFYVNRQLRSRGSRPAIEHFRVTTAEYPSPNFVGVASTCRS